MNKEPGTRDYSLNQDAQRFSKNITIIITVIIIIPDYSTEH